jgi:hypothetical protein
MIDMAMPHVSGRREFQPARLSFEEQRVRDWFDCLTEAERQRSYSLAEIRAAVSIPATRLRVVLYRLGWKPRREAGFGVFTYFKASGSPWPSDIADSQSIIAKLREGS